MSRNDLRLHPLAPVVALDIDGTTADYYNHFKWFAELYMQEKITVNWGHAFNDDFDRALGLDKQTYRDIKLAYRQGGMKRSLPVLDLGVEDLVPSIRELGVQVWVCTTRPWLRLDNIDPDTRFWITRHFGRIDGLIYGEDKYSDLIDIVGKDRILGIVDDIPDNIVRATELGLPSSLRTGPQNARWRREEMSSGQPTSSHSIEIFNQVKKWKEHK
jgi:hypothetical protein